MRNDAEARLATHREADPTRGGCEERSRRVRESEELAEQQKPGRGHVVGLCKVGHGRLLTFWPCLIGSLGNAAPYSTHDLDSFSLLSESQVRIHSTTSAHAIWHWQ